MGKSIGIDLGTTNSVVGVRKVCTEILLNAEGKELTPSCVGFQKELKQKKIIVGSPALDFLIQDPVNTIVSVKRLMGRNYADPEVQRMVSERRYAYSICPLSRGTENSVAVKLGGEEYTPEQISAKILEKLKVDAEARLGECAQAAVVTVPAYFNDKQKHATRVAAELAGFTLLRLLPEPTAAAIAFGIDEMMKEEAKTVLVYDFGGGTFDISVLTMTNGHFIEQGKGGDMWLGGDDIDRLIVEFVYRQVEKETRLKDLASLALTLKARERYRFLGELKRKAEEAKIELSHKEVANIEILGLLRDPRGATIDVDVTLTRKELEKLISPMVDRSLQLVLKVLEEIHFEPSLIDCVLLVGGCSSIPLVQQRVRQVFGSEKVRVHPRPMLAVAEGAAILAVRLSDKAETVMGEILHTTSHDYYLELAGGKQHLLVPKNTPLPHQTEGVFRLVDKEQRLAHFQFSNRVNETFEPIGDLWLSYEEEADEEGAKELTEVVLSFEIDENNLIRVRAQLKDRPEIEVTRTLSRGNIDETLYRKLEQGIRVVNEGRGNRYVAQDYMKAGVGIAKEIHHVIDPASHTVNEERVARVEKKQLTADELARQEESTWCRLYYAQELLRNFSELLDKKGKEAIWREVEYTQGKIEEGMSVGEITAALKRLNGSLDKHSKTAGMLMNIENAAHLADTTDPARARVLRSCVNRMAGALKNGDTEGMKNAMSEALPLTYGVLADYARTKFHIHKELTHATTL